MQANNQRHLGKEDLKKVLKVEGNGNLPKKTISTGTLIARIICGIIGVLYVAALIGGRFLIKETDALYPYYQSFDVFSADNPFKIIRIASLILLAVTAGTVLRLIIEGLSKSKTVTKKTGVAVIQLIGSVLKYVIVIVVICLILSALGVDTAGIFAGLGVIALIIGLGVTSLIEDIVAGIFIIAEKLFDVGNIIVLDGFRGTVVSIGIRSTKIADVGGDILTVRNSSIGSLVNLTDRQSCAALTIPISPDESLQKVEEIIKNGHLESIKETCDKIIGDPLYLGLCDINAKGVQMLLFIAGCKEDDRYDVERALYHGIKVMLESNGVKLGSRELMVDEEK